MRPLTRDDAERVRVERNALPDGILRTPYKLTPEMQQEWYEDVICDRRSTTRYWALWDRFEFVGYGGIENIQWENGIGELSVMIFSDYRGQGYGSEAVDRFIDEAFNSLRLATVYAEVYESNPNIRFWQKIAPSFVFLPNRRYCNGRYYDSMYITWTRV